ncbi:NUDIX hydrolase [Methanobrevibacter millerae]|uniref:8-oxo-dGTP diphosphatase n=1 Tax=Methanobrevibacter millerae TaxID=230361 RepID=A0A1G5VMY7_9EURY|nr:NUDIX domain-containing protein [Methanobrevibacter millerae]SDA46567.1 8-oxo-dGTP diphosphatase [Methanobrevibacter millerae]
MSNMWGLTARGICEYDGKILLLKVRSKSSHDAEKWEIPGGKVKKGEFFDQALKREFMEETGLEIDIESLYNVIQNNYTACKTNESIKSIQLIMKVTSTTDEVKISQEHDEYRWFTKEELKELIDKEMLSRAAMNSFDDTILGGEL